jgi:GMP synthase (glutamine-hydrolysing)
MIFIVDFGSQTAHLIARRIKDLGSSARIILPEKALEAIRKERPNGIILSGGPASVYQKGSPTINKEIFNLNIPLLGICYGWQIVAKLLGGNVKPTAKEYGPELITIRKPLGILGKLPKKQFIVYVSHGDSVIALPEGFIKIAQTKNVEYTAVQNVKKHLYGVQFHPEVDHTEYGKEILKNFIDICGIKKTGEKGIDIKSIEENIKQIVGDKYVIGAVSGGVDSTVAAVLTAKAIGKQFIPVYVDNGLMREGTVEHVKKIFVHIGIEPVIVNAQKETILKLKGVMDSEEKRKIIGNLYIKLFEEEMVKQVKLGKNVAFLMQGTIYSDVIESKGTKNADKIKSHHNVGGLPKNMKLKLVEPVRNFYKDQVREIGRKLKLPADFIHQQPFPGPGFAVRIRGEVTAKRLSNEKMADKIVLEELKNAHFFGKVFQSFPVLTGAYSTAVKGDGRNFGEVIALRIVESKDIMTCDWARLPYELLQKISSRIVNEVPGISRVVYDITTKPPATMEWE